MSPSPTTIIARLEHVDAYLGETHALRDLSWRMESGQNWAILGPNGAGKSALIKLLASDVYPAPRPDAAFEILSRNRMAPGVNIWELRKEIGIISPELQADYLPDTPGLHVVLSGYFSSNGMYDRVTARQRARARDIIGELGVTHLEKRPIGTVSYGEARRLLIARALIHDPHLLVFDEPTQGLDLAAAEHFLHRIGELAARGHAIVIVTHHLHEIIAPITHIALLRDGQIRKSGPKAKLMRAGIFREAYKIPIRIVRQDDRYWALPALIRGQSAK